MVVLGIASLLPEGVTVARPFRQQPQGPALEMEFQELAGACFRTASLIYRRTAQYNKIT
jgi:hypothetical protein